MARGKKKVQNKLLPKVLELEQALGGQVERQVVIEVLKSVGEDAERAMELLVQMIAEPVTVECENRAEVGLVDPQTVYHAPLESKADETATHTTDGHCTDQQIQSPRSMTSSGPNEDNSSSDFNEQIDGNWSMLLEMFKGLLSVDELADMYFMQQCDLESTVASALNTVDDDCGDNTAIFDEIATNSDFYYQPVDITMDSVLQSLAALTSQQSAVVEALERIFPDREVGVLLGVAETVNFDLDEAVAVLLDGHTVEASASSAAASRGSNKASRTFLEAMSGQQAGSLMSKMASPEMKEQEFPQLRPEAPAQPSSQSPKSSDHTPLSIADKLKLKELYQTFPSCSRSTIRRLYLGNDRSAHNVMILLGFQSSTLSARVSSQPYPPPQFNATVSPSLTMGSRPNDKAPPARSDSHSSGEAAENKRPGRKGNYVPWTVVDSGRKTKKQQPQRYIPGLNQPEAEAPPVDTEEYWREQANIAKQRMRESFLHAAQLRRELGGDAAHEAAARGKEFKERMNLYNSRAAACTIRNRNDGVQAEVVGNSGAVCYRNSQPADGAAPATYVRVDLHGLFVREAIQFLVSLIDQYSATKAKVTVDAITGVGNNSQGGRARLMEATVRLLKQKQIPFQVNGGTVRFKT